MQQCPRMHTQVWHLTVTVCRKSRDVGPADAASLFGRVTRHSVSATQAYQSRFSKRLSRLTTLTPDAGAGAMCCEQTRQAYAPCEPATFAELGESPIPFMLRAWCTHRSADSQRFWQTLYRYAADEYTPCRRPLPATIAAVGAKQNSAVCCYRTGSLE